MDFRLREESTITRVRFTSLARTKYYRINTGTGVPPSDVRIFKISNRIVTLVFDSKRVQIFEIFKYLPSPISYLFKQNDADFSP